MLCKHACLHDHVRCVLTHLKATTQDLSTGSSARNHHFASRNNHYDQASRFDTFLPQICAFITARG